MEECSLCSQCPPAIQEGRLSILDYFWKHSGDSVFIVIIDQDGDFAVEDFNPAQARMFMTNDTLKGKKLKDLFDRPTYTKLFERYTDCIDRNQPATYEENHVIDGKTRYWNTMLIPMIDSIDGNIRVFGISRELTQLVDAKEALATINQGLEQAITKRTLELQQSNEKLKKQSRKLEEQAYIDPLTQIGNRRHFFKRTGTLIDSPKANNLTVSLIYIDLDDFKAINDTHGHSAGDKILTEFVNRVKGHSLNTDIFSRFGGEEFILLMPNTSLATANEKAQKILQSISMEPFIIDGKDINVTSSIGVAEGNFNDNFNLDALISNADKALYSAKMNGKNRVEVYKL